MKIKWLYLFWGSMDSFYFAWFFYASFAQGRIPIYSDIQSFVLLLSEYGYWAALIFLLTFLFILSMVVSMVLFFRGSPKIPALVYAQAPFRLLLVIPSIPFISWSVWGLDLGSVWFSLVLLLLSETVKLGSIFFRHKLFAVN